MNIWRRLRRAGRGLFHKRQLDLDMDAEMRSHIEMRTQANIGGGMDPEEACYAALCRFGWTESIKEDCREQRGVRWLEDRRGAGASAGRRGTIAARVSCGVSDSPGPAGGRRERNAACILSPRAGGRREPGAMALDGRRRLRAAHRLRQRGWPVAGPRQRPEE